MFSKITILSILSIEKTPQTQVNMTYDLNMTQAIMKKVKGFGPNCSVEYLVMLMKLGTIYKIFTPY